jgi:hypothetical protein
MDVETDIGIADALHRPAKAVGERRALAHGFARRLPNLTRLAANYRPLNRILFLIQPHSRPRPHPSVRAIFVSYSQSAHQTMQS